MWRISLPRKLKYNDPVLTKTGEVITNDGYILFVQSIVHAGAKNVLQSML